MKAIESLKHFTFTHRRSKAVKKFRALKLWSKTTSRKVFACLRVYSEYKKQKKHTEALVLMDRARTIKQALLFKMGTTAKYWLQKKDKTTESVTHARVKQAFFKLYANSKQGHHQIKSHQSI
jgi:hypothetical protein